jgi:type II secretory pathway pseudopilin PulG
MELMFASGVLAISMGVLFGSLVSLSTSGQVAEGKTQATAYMLSVLEQVRSTSRANIFTFTPPAAPANPGFTMAITLEALDASGGANRLPLADSSVIGSLPDPIPVRATVVFATSRGNLYSVTSTTYAGKS